MASGATPILMNDTRMLKNIIDEEFVSIREHSCKRVTLITGISLLFGDFFVPLQLMKRASYIFLIVLMLAACGGWRDGQRLLDRADSLLYGQPDSALRLLDSITEDDQERMSEAQLMRYHLLRLSAQNKCDTVFRSDSLQLVLTDYYDRRGSANEQMMAYYLLGRAYADMGEAPAALQAYQNAVDKADTTSKEIDYHLLGIIHGQIGSLYQKQNLARYDINELTLASMYALMSGDTLSAVLYEEQKAPEYYMLEDKDSSLIIYEKTARFFEQKGMKQYASIIRGLCALLYIERREMDKAAESLRIYESCSGHLDCENKPMAGREIYYFWKGRYFEALGRSDSAIVCYMRLMQTAQSFNDKNAAADGLYREYMALGIKDSISRYARLSMELIDSVYSRSTADMLQKLQAEYNYSRNQRLAEHRRHQVEVGRRTNIISVLLIILIVAFSFHLRKLYKRRIMLKESELLSVRAASEQDRRDLDKAKTELQILIEQKTELEQETKMYLLQKDSALDENKRRKNELSRKERELASKEKEIEEKDALVTLLGQRVRDFEKNYSSVIVHDKPGKDKCFQTQIYQRLHFLSSHPLSNVSPKEWIELEKMMEEAIPDIKFSFKEKFRLKVEDYRICLLILLSFNPGEIATLMDVTHDIIAKKRRRLHKKVFHTDGSPSEFDLKLRLLF